MPTLLSDIDEPQASIRTEIRKAVSQLSETARAIADAIKEAGEIPSGTLYVVVMSYVPLGEYEAIIDALVGAKLITNTNHLLRWVGEFESASSEVER